MLTASELSLGQATGTSAEGGNTRHSGQMASGGWRPTIDQGRRKGPHSPPTDRRLFQRPTKPSQTHARAYPAPIDNLRVLGSVNLCLV